MVSINSILDNLKEKVTNPFFGTFIVVWLIRNWDLVYTVFNFEDNASLYNKKKFIGDYFHNKNIFWEFFLNFLISLGLLLIGYLFVIISRMILNVVYHNFIPYLNNKLVSKLVVNKERFDTVKKTRDEYFQKILDMEEERVALEQSNTMTKTKNIELESRLSNLNLANDDLVYKNREFEEKNITLELQLNNIVTSENELSKNYEFLTNEYQKIELKLNYFKSLVVNKVLTKNQFLNSKTTYTKINNGFALSYTVPDEIIKIGDILKNNDTLNDFYFIADNFENDDFYKTNIITYNNQIDKFTKLKLMEIKQNNGKLKITELGNELLLYRLYLTTD